jgi:hypothetical protein
MHVGRFLQLRLDVDAGRAVDDEVLKTPDERGAVRLCERDPLWPLGPQ